MFFKEHENEYVVGFFEFSNLSKGKGVSMLLGA